MHKIIKEIITKDFIIDLIKKKLLWTIPWKLVSSGILMLSWWNLIVIVIILAIKEKYWFDFYIITNSPNYIGLFLIILWFIWYSFDKFTIIQNNTKSNLDTFKNEYENIKYKWIKYINNSNEEEYIVDKNIKEIEEILDYNYKQAKKLLELFNNRTYVIQIIGKDLDYIHKFIIWICNIRWKEIMWRIVNDINSLMKIIEYNEKWIILLSEKDYSDKIGAFLSKWNTLVIKTTYEIDNISKILLEDTKEKPNEFENKLYTN